MYNERITENLVRNKFRALGYYSNPEIIIEEQKSEQPRINKLLKNASKGGNSRGLPEFIISFKYEKDFVCVFECKSDITKHQSKNFDKYKDFAVDGAKLYSDYLSKEMDVLFIGVSGQTEEELKVSHYIQLRGEKEVTSVFGNEILSYESYLETYKALRFRIDYQNLVKYLKTLNETLHKKKIPEDKRAILFSGILIALEDKTFSQTYRLHHNSVRLSNSLLESITHKLKESNVPVTRIYEMEQAFNFIKTHTTLIDEEYLFDLIHDIHSNVRIFTKTNQYFDILSKAYIEFLRYANNDKGLGIVLTPSHITDLFCDLSNISKDSVVFDNCCGTGGFLVSAMDKMVKLAQGDKTKIDNIKKNQLIGIEYQDHIFTLCCSNMVIHGDGKTNIIKGDCFKKIDEIKNYKPNIGFLNPPYNTGINELKFVLNNLSALEKNSLCIAILPISCALNQKGANHLKEQLLANHTLEAVLSMPDDLFYPVGVVTCIMIFKAYQPHPTDYKTYFGYWKDDGHIKRKHQGRIDSGRWLTIKKSWINSFRNKESQIGFSTTQAATANDEWCAEAYMETDYSKLSAEHFIKKIHNYSAFQFLMGRVEEATKTPFQEDNISLFDREWMSFKYEEVFNIYGGYYNKKPETIENGDIPFIGATDSNNGITSMHTKEIVKVTSRDGKLNNHDISKKIFRGNSITISNNGSVGYAFYQPIDFTCSHDINPIDLKGHTMNPFISMFLCTLIELERFRWAYGRKWRPIRMPSSLIKLPVDSNKNIDWMFMENYIKSLPYSKNLSPS